MRGASTTDGKMHGNRQLVEAYDKDHGKKSKHLNQRPHESGGESGGQALGTAVQRLGDGVPTASWSPW